MDDGCMDLLMRSYKHGDRHYRGMRDWLLTQLSDKSRTKCQELALIYQDSLDELLECLNLQTGSDHLRVRIKHTLDFQQLLERDLKILAEHADRYPQRPGPKNHS